MADYKYPTAGQLHIWYNAEVDESGYDESMDCSFTICSECGLMTIEEYYDACRRFAAAFGYTNKAIEEYFGKEF